MHATMTNIGAFFASRAGGMSTLTAGGAGDNTPVAGTYVDRRGALSGKAVLYYKATLAQGKTLTVGIAIKDADDSNGTNAASYGSVDLTAAVVATGPTGGGVVEGTIEVNVDLTAARGFVNANWTPDLNANGTDVATIALTWLLGGQAAVPAT